MSAFVILFSAAIFSFAINKQQWLKLFSLLSLLLATYFTLTLHATPLSGFTLSSAALFFESIVFIVLFAVILNENDSLTITQTLFLGSASILLLESDTLLSFILSFEALSIISFVLVSHIEDKYQAEGAVKMFISGAIATGLILFGLTLFTLDGHDFTQPLSGTFSAYSTVALLIVLIGIFYKLTIVPMHSWAVDGYSLIRPTHAALLSGVAKTVVAVGAFKIFVPFLQVTSHLSTPLLITLSVVTMTLGNVLALYQKNLAKILAYSSIAHAGYMLLAFVAVKSSYAPYGLLYLAVAYIFMQTAAFLWLALLQKKVVTLDMLKGLGTSHPYVSFFLTLQLFSLAGIPLLAGFLGKAVAIYAVVDAGFWIVALITLLNSALSVGYYAWIVKHLYFDTATSQTPSLSWSVNAFVSQVILLAGTLYFGLYAFSIFNVSF